MPVVADYTKLPKTLLLELLNVANGLNLEVSQLDFLNFTPSELPGNNTQAEVWWRTTPDMIGSITIHFSRMDLGIIFSQTGIVLKKANVDSDTDGLILNQKVFDEIHRRYGVVFNDDEFDLVIDGELYFFTAVNNNEAYCGSVVIEVLADEGISDTASITDATFYEASMFLDEVIDITDSLTMEAGVTQADVAVVSDTMLMEANSVISDALAINEIVSLEAYSFLGDAVNIAETVSTAAEMSNSDSLGISDNISTEATSAATDTATATDTIAAEATSVSADSLTATDAVAAVATAVLAESAAITDTVSMEANVSLTDTSAVTDTVKTEVNTSTADSVTTSDALVVEVQKPVSDSVTTTDSFTFIARSYPSEMLGGGGFGDVSLGGLFHDI